MLIQYTIFLFGVNLGLSIAKNSESSTIEVGNASFMNFELGRNKPKREVDGSAFDISSFDDFSDFTETDNNREDRAADFEVDNEDIGSVISSSSIKVARKNLGILGDNTKPLNFHISPQFDSSAQQSTPQQSSRETYDILSAEIQSVPDQVQQINMATSQVTTPFFGSFVTYPAQSSTYRNENPFKTRFKVPFNANLPLTDRASTIPVFTPLTQAPFKRIAASHQHQAQQSQNSPYKTHFLRDINMNPAKMYAPSHRHNQQQYGAPFQNFRHNPYNRLELSTIPPISINGKKMSQSIIHVQSAPNFSRYLQPLGTTRLIYNAETGLPYRTQPSYAGNLDYSSLQNINERSGKNTPFLSTSHSGPAQILPVHAASSTAQFPRYKGASVAQFPSRGFYKTPDDYQDFQLQTQLHFDSHKNNKFKNYPVSAAPPFSRIRTDVEVIDKKKPIPPLPSDDDDGDGGDKNDESSEGYDNDDTYSPKSEEDDEVESPPKNRKEFELEGGFRPSKSFSFKEYNKKHEKNKKNSADSAEKDDDNVSINLAAKYYFDKSAEDIKDESTEDGAQSKLNAYTLNDDFDNHSNENEEEGETQKEEEKHFTTEYSPHGIRKPRARQNDNYNEKDKKLTASSNYRIKESDEANEGNDHFNADNYRSPTKLLKKNSRRAYQDVTEELLNPTTSGANQSLQKKGHFNSKLNENNSGTNWRSAYRPKAVNKNDDDDNGFSFFSDEETSEPTSSKPINNGFTGKSPLITTQQYVSSQLYPTTRPILRTSTVLAKETITPQNTANIGFTTFVSHKDYEAKEKNFNPILSSISKQPLNILVKPLVNTRPNYQNPFVGRGEIYKSLKGI